MDEPTNEGKKSLADAMRQDIQKDADATRSKLDEIRQRYESMRKRKIEDDVQVIEAQPCEVLTVSEDSEDSSSPVKKAKAEEKLPSFTSMADASFKPLIQPVHLELAQEQHRKDVEVVSLDEESEPTAIVDNSKPEEQPKEKAVERRNGSTGRPLVKITFYDRELASEYGALVREAVAQTLSAPPDVKEGNKSKSSPLEFVVRESDLNSSINSEGQTFTLDTEPETTAVKWKVPSYSQSFKTIDGKEAEKIEEPEKRSGGGCFNCCGNHMISECPKPIDQRVVNENRAKFRASSNQMKTSRYHADDEQKYAKHRPGHISDELRQALGLRPDQLPLHTYYMRLHGYPPGWLEEARVKHSGITLIEDANSSKELVEANQGGEIDASKIIDFPGFNVPYQLGTMDEWYEMGMPQLQYQFSKKAMLRLIKTKQQARQTCADDVVEIEDDDDDCVILESNTPEHGSSVLPPGESQTRNNRPGSSTAQRRVSHEAPQSPESPDIELLEASKMQILEELGDEDDASPKSPEKTETANCVCATPETTVGRSVSSSLGTPVIESWTPYEKLPTAEKFSQGVSEHLNFENLPGATGKYEQMKGIIKRVKKCVQDASSK